MGFRIGRGLVDEAEVEQGVGRLRSRYKRRHRQSETEARSQGAAGQIGHDVSCCRTVR
jgi:hypothetical protein